MRLFFNILLSVVALMGMSSCVENADQLPQSIDGCEVVEGEVRLVLPEQGSRAALAADGVNFAWQLGDRFKLVARDSGGKNAFTPCNFTYWVNTTTASRNFFRGMPDSDMTDGNYTYYAVYPHTATVGANTITYTLPIIQDGNYATHDFMVAKSTEANSAATSGNALKKCDDNFETPEPLNDIKLTFKHLFHALRITIPEGRNLMNVPIKKVYVNFPAGVNVVGDITVDMATMAATYTNTFNAVTVEFDQPKNVGEEFWIMTLPMNVGGGKVDLRFEDEQGNISSPISTTALATCDAGTISPMTVTVPQSAGKMTYFDFSVDHDKLGEPVTHLHITPPSGCYYMHGSGGQMPDESGKFTFSVFPDQLSSFKGYSTSAIKYESVHAIVPENVSRTFSSSATQGNRYSQPVATPWLFSQDFNNVGTFNDGHDAPNNGWKSDTYSEVKQVSTISNSKNMSDWYASRIGVSNGALRLCCRMEYATKLADAFYKGRLDTPYITTIKDGATPKIKVSFKYGSATNEYAMGSTPNGSPVLYVGYSDANQDLKIDTGEATTVTMTKCFLEGQILTGRDGSYTNMPSTQSVVMTDFSNKNRITWIVSTNATPLVSFGNGNYWLYMDDLTVSIEQ